MFVLPLLAAAALGPDIIVTGRGLSETPGDVAYDIVTIDRTRLEQSASGRLEDVLRDVAGLQQFRRSDSRSANPTSQGVTLRGLGGNAASRALLILDGVPQADPFGGWVAFPAYAPERLGQVRITRGGGSGVFGPGALAGTIELTSAGPGELPPIGAHLAYGSRESVEADALASARLGGGFATLSADYARGDGFVPIVAGQRGPADRPAPYEQASVAARGVIPVGETTELQANLIAFTDRRERGTAFTRDGSDGADASLRLVGHGDWGFSALAYLQTRAFQSQFASVNDDRSAASQVLDQYNTPATGLGARLEVAPPLGADIDLRAGADWRRTSGRTEELFTFVNGAPTRGRLAGGVSSTVGAFADLSWTLGGVTLSAGGRLDRWSIRDGFLAERTLATAAPLTDSHFPDRSGWEPTGRAGIAWHAADTVTLRAAAYAGWRLPTLNELYRPFRVGADATAANAALSPERLQGGELGVEFRPAPTVRLGATVFDNRLENAIANVTVARGPGNFPGVGFVSAAGFYRVRQNLDAIRSRGLELDGAATLGAWRLGASYALTDARVRASGLAAPLDGLRPAQTPRHTASGTLAWTGRALQASATLRYVSSQFEDDQNTRSLRDALTLDARLAVPLRKGLSLEARAENLTDTRVEAAVSADGVIERATPRTLWLGVRFGG
ncbi:putative TonB-dependent receptor [Sphingomonas changbaiensis NBRC 104936]|uniref:Putative TonB-dependent receptor n=1 Tax=Sphingomonas changbaiensis NBRC 104936 TaxID=1219043 RepID=A0A0E9MSX2_9SPHN|nr:TonB-dependent receptor [Sphingomonas changbaiensis]GAO40573.1 putative TonB-dependent receptor [Sphingomonas changbaiensis NBRC 104936]